MIIDFHTHIFPDEIAPKVVSRLASIIGMEPSIDGTVQGLRASMEKGGVNVSVILPVITAPHQFESVIRFGTYINETFSWDNTIYDLLSISCYHLNKIDYALYFVDLALQYTPSDQRLLNNRKIFKEKED